jgi:uncharacterized membrane protein
MRTWISLLIIVVGAVSLVFGIVFIVQSGSAKQQIADDIAPLTLDQVDAQYDAVVLQHEAIMQKEPLVRVGKAESSVTYNYLTIQRTSLGLTRSNIGQADFIRTTGIIDIILGVGFLFSGAFLMQKKTA